ncbi:MAG: PEP-CTERM sorting domain-containing protein [Steroidobacteraceae bacterium]
MSTIFTPDFRVKEKAIGIMVLSGRLGSCFRVSKTNNIRGKSVMRRATWGMIFAVTLGMAGIDATTGLAHASEILVGSYLNLNAAAFSSLGTACSASQNVDTSDFASVSAAFMSSSCSGATASAAATAAAFGAVTETASATSTPSAGNTLIQTSASANNWDFGIVSVPADGITQISIVETLSATISGLSFAVEYNADGLPVYVPNASISDEMLWDEGTTESCSAISCLMEIDETGGVQSSTQDGPVCTYAGGCMPTDGSTNTITQTFLVGNGDAIAIYEDPRVAAYAGGAFSDGPVTATLVDPLEIEVADGVTIDWSQPIPTVQASAPPATSVPEPSSPALLVMGLAAIVGSRCLRRQQ